MTVADLRCDFCGQLLVGLVGAPAAMPGALGVRFMYHPGDVTFKDDGGLACEDCFAAATKWLGTEAPLSRCSHCGAELGTGGSLYVVPVGESRYWRLCRADTVAFLNRLRTVEPKLSLESFQFPASSRADDQG